MKKLLLAIGFILTAGFAFSQTNLENVYVEKVPVTPAALAADPSLPVGSVAYRVFLDMAPGYEAQAVFAVAAHQIILGTTTSFYNNADGVASGRALGNTTFNNAAGRFDSYLTIDGVTSTRIGVRLDEDTDGTVDGYTLGTSLPMGSVGTDWEIPFGAASYSGVFTTNTGIWNVAGGETGTTPSNSVLIGQFTTNGDFNFELNVQIRRTDGTGAQKYVARNPLAGEFVLPSLIYTSVESNIAPVATITSPLNNADVFTGTDVTVAVNVTDANTVPVLQAINSVEFRVDGGAAISDATAPYSFTWNAGAIRNGVVLEARAINTSGLLAGPWAPVTVDVVRQPVTPTVTLSANDVDVLENDVVTFTAAAVVAADLTASYVFSINGVAQAPQASGTFTWTAVTVGPAVPVSVTVTNIDGTATANLTVKVTSGATSYEVVSFTQNCNIGSSFCIPVLKVGTPLVDVTGFEFDVIYPVAKVRPTGGIDVFVNAGGADADNTEFRVNDLGNGTMHVEINLDPTSLATDGWDGIDTLFCIGFVKTASFLPNDAVTIGISNIYQSTIAGKGDIKVGSAGTFTTFSNNTYTGIVKFWADDSPIYGQGAPVTRIQIGANPIVNTNAAGQFTASFGTGANMIMHIDKDVWNIVPAGDLLAVYGGYDAYLTAKVLVNDLTFLPSAQQVIAMDVDRDGKVGAGDVSQIQQRAVTGVFSNPKDWVFFNESRLFEDLSYRRSGGYPAGDATGFSKDRVPSVPYDINLSSVVANPTTCPVILDGKNVYYGVAVGDVDGSWALISTDFLRKSAKAKAPEVTFDLKNAYYEEEYVNIPVMVSSENAVNSLDFAIQFDSQKVSFENILNRTSYIKDFSGSDENYVALTSYSLEAYEVDEPIFSVRFRAADGFDSKNLTETVSYVNGVKVNTVINSSTGIKNLEAKISVYPNPATNMLKVRVSEEVNLQMFDVNGKSMYSKSNVNGLQEIDVQGFAEGVYMMKISNDRFSTVKRVVIQK